MQYHSRQIVAVEILQGQIGGRAASLIEEPQAVPLHCLDEIGWRHWEILSGIKDAIVGAIKESRFRQIIQRASAIASISTNHSGRTKPETTSVVEAPR